MDEFAFAVSPVVQDSIQHNARALSNVRALSSIVLGLCAGLLHLESLQGFGFYAGGSLLVSALLYGGPLGRAPERFIWVQKPGASDDEQQKTKKEKGGGIGMWAAVALGGGVLGMESVMAFVMCWTIGYAIVEG